MCRKAQSNEKRRQVKAAMKSGGSESAGELQLITEVKGEPATVPVRSEVRLLLMLS